MSKKGYVWVGLLLIVPVILTACGSKKDKKTLELKQTFTSTTGITFNYPDGWLARDSDYAIEISNTQRGLEDLKFGLNAEIAAGTFELQIGLMTEDMDGKSITEILQVEADHIAQRGAQTSAVKTVKIDGKDGARFDVTGYKSGSEAFMLLLMLDNNTVMMAAGLFHQGELSQYEDTALKVLDSITYQAPPTSTPGPPTATQLPVIMTVPPAPTTAPNVPATEPPQAATVPPTTAPNAPATQAN